GSIDGQATLGYGTDGLPLHPFYENYAGQTSMGSYADGDPGRTVLVYEFTATATTHDLVFAVTGPERSAQLLITALVVQRTPAELAVLTTYAAPFDDALWTFTGAVPGDLTRSAYVDPYLPGPGARAYGFEVVNDSSGTVPTDPDTFGMELQL